MPQNRFFIDDPLLIGSIVELERKEQHHLKVMRNPQTVELINGKGKLAIAAVLPSGLKVIDIAEDTEPETVILCQALPRLNRLDTILEKGTEIGMREVWLFPGERSEKKELSKNQLERAEHVLQAALKQCGRLYLPLLRFLPPLRKWKKPEGQVLFGALEGGSLLPKIEPPTLFFVGPEAGFSQEEEQLLTKWGEGVTLNSAILRTDTAPLVALSLINYQLNDPKKFRVSM